MTPSGGIFVCSLSGFLYFPSHALRPTTAPRARCERQPAGVSSSTMSDASAADLLRIVISYRQRGVPASEVHALLPRLLKETRAAGFEVPMIDVPTGHAPALSRVLSTELLSTAAGSAGGIAATVTLACEHFCLDVVFNAAADLASAVGELQLQHCSQTAPVWPHATLPELERELQARLIAGDAVGFCALLTALRCFQGLLACSGRPERPYGSVPADWADAQSTLKKLLGRAPEGGCEGLRARYYVPAGQEEDEGEEHWLVVRPSPAPEAAAIAGAPAGGGGGAVGASIVLRPPLLLEEGAARELARLGATGGAEVAAEGANGAVGSAGSAQPRAWFAAIRDAQGGATLPTTASDAAAAAQETVVPLRLRSHRQQWNLGGGGGGGRGGGGGGFRAVWVAEVRLGGAAAPLAHLVATLRAAACAARVWRSAWHEPLLLLRSPAALRLIDDAPAAATPSTAAAEAPRTYHVELQPLPPAELCLIVPLGTEGGGAAAPSRKRGRAAPPAAAAAAAAAAPRLAQLRLRLEQGLDSTRLEWIAGTAGKAGAAGADADAEAYAARLLNECHSLPLTVAFVVQRALP